MIGRIFFLPVQKVVGGKKIEENWNFINFCAHWSKVFHTSDKNVRAVLSNLRCTCPEDFGRKNPLKKLLQLFFWLWAESFQSFSEFFSTCISQSSFFISRAICWREKMFEEKKFIFFSEFWTEGFRVWGKIVEAVISKLPSRYPVRNFGWFCLSKILIFTFGRSFCGNFSCFEWTLLAIFSKRHPKFMDDF